jgi:26S proteasome regulatory subunit (ATPase 3-interacting protein)
MDDSFGSEIKPATKRLRPSSRATKTGSTARKDAEVNDLFKSLEVFINEEPEKHTLISTANGASKQKPVEETTALKSRDPSKDATADKEQTDGKGVRGRKPKNKKNDEDKIVEEAPPQEIVKPEKAPKEKGPKKKAIEEKDDKSKVKKGAPVQPPNGLGGSPEETVLEYMRKQNRPYSLINVFDNLHGKIKKPDLQKILDKLVKDKKLIEKEFGKCLVYWYNQDLIEVNKERLEAEGERYAQARDTVDTLKKSLQEAKAKLAQIDRVPTTDSFKDQIKKCEEEIPSLENKLERYQNNSEPMASMEQINDLEFSISEMERLKVRRRKMFGNIIDALLEQTGLPKKKLFEKIGLE